MIILSKAAAQRAIGHPATANRRLETKGINTRPKEGSRALHFRDIQKKFRYSGNGEPGYK